MYPAKIVNVRSDQEFDVDLGTCDYCMRSEDLTKFYFTFDVNGQTVEMENGEWDYDYYYEYFQFDNVINFINKFNALGLMVNGIKDITENWIDENRSREYWDED